MITYWLIGPASRLVWFFPVLFIPMAISVFLYPKVLDKKWGIQKFFLICLFGYILVFLRSYVYAPVLVLSGAVPVFYYEVKNQEKIGKILLLGIQVSLIGVLGFTLVMGIHFIQLWVYMESPVEAYSLLLEKALFRGPSGERTLQVPLEIFLKYMDIRVVFLSKYIYSLFPQVEAPLERVNSLRSFHFMAFISVILVWILIIVDRLIKAIKLFSQRDRHMLFALSLTTIAAMASSWSWFPALGHMAAHLHMNGIMYIIPFGLSTYALIGVLVESILKLVVAPPEE